MPRLIGMVQSTSIIYVLMRCAPCRMSSSILHRNIRSDAGIGGKALYPLASPYCR